MSEIDLKDELMHHGVLGMKWGEWNPETAARYAGIPFTKKTKKLLNNVSEKHKQKKEEKREQKEFDKQTRKQYGLSSKQYKDLRTRTLNSNDPMVVEKGMHLLTDKELQDKIERLDKEKRIRDIASAKKLQQETYRNKQKEARQKTLSYNLAKLAGETAIKTVNESIFKPGANEFYKRLRDEADRASDSIKKSKENEKEKESNEKQKKSRKDSSDELRAYLARRAIRDANTKARMEELDEADRASDSIKKSKENEKEKDSNEKQKESRKDSSDELRAYLARRAVRDANTKARMEELDELDPSHLKDDNYYRRKRLS